MYAIESHQIIKGPHQKRWHIRKPRSLKGYTYCGRRVHLPQKENDTLPLQQRGSAVLCRWCVQTFESDWNCRGVL